MRSLRYGMNRSLVMMGRVSYMLTRMTPCQCPEHCNATALHHSRSVSRSSSTMSSQSFLQCLTISKVGVKLVKRLYLNVCLEHDIACKVSWKCIFDLVGCMRSGGNCENVIKFFEGSLLGLDTLGCN